MSNMTAVVACNMSPCDANVGVSRFQRLHPRSASSSFWGRPLTTMTWNTSPTICSVRWRNYVILATERWSGRRLPGVVLQAISPCGDCLRTFPLSPENGCPLMWQMCHISKLVRYRHCCWCVVLPFLPSPNHCDYHRVTNMLLWS